MSSSSPLNSSSFRPEVLRKSLTETRERLKTAALRHGRDPNSIGLLAVSKQQSAEAVRVIAEQGQRDFGENYLQEALDKIEAIADPALVWHYIGQVQSNKTRSVARHFQWVHTVDRIKIAERLNEQRPIDSVPLQVCIQVKLAEEEGKGGVAPQVATSLARAIATLPRLKLRGIMCIPPPRDTYDEQLAYFREAASLLHRLRTEGHALDTLSMGMSADLEAAVAAGATIVRVGTGIFGQRTRHA